MVIWGCIGVLGLFIWFGYDLPDISEIAQCPRQPSILIVDENGNTLANYGDLYGKTIKVKELPPHVIGALLATEDRRFYSHLGVDFLGIVRAIVQNIKAGGVVQGGSTITQQLAKNFLQAKKVYTAYDRSFQRKLSEAILAFFIEWRFSKEEILTMYLNRVYLGAGTYGLDAASMRYFGHSANALGLYESAMLMGLLRAPSRYSPANNPERADGRAKQVLLSMVESGFITQEAADAALAMPTPLDEGLKRNFARYFTDWILDEIPKYVPLGTEDIRVITTINPVLQKIAEHQARQIMGNLGIKWKAHQVALVALKPDGAVQAMVGGVNYRHSKFNRVTQGLRQPGSSFKYFVWLSALEAGYKPWSRISDGPIYFNGWAPKNFKYHARGEISLTEALALSVNTVSIRLTQYAGVRRVIKMAKRLGITTPLPSNYSIALGTGSVTLLEMAGAFAVLANEGFPAAPYGILEIRTTSGKLLYKHSKKPQQERLLSGKVVEQMAEMMTCVTEYGTGRMAKISGVDIPGKTGTTQKNRDSWFIGMTEDLVTAVWTGNDTEIPMMYHSGGSPSVHLWKAFNVQAMDFFKNPKAAKWDFEENETLADVLEKGRRTLLKHGPVSKDVSSEEDEEEQEDDGDDEEGDSGEENREDDGKDGQEDDGKEDREDDGKDDGKDDGEMKSHGRKTMNKKIRQKKEPLENISSDSYSQKNQSSRSLNAGRAPDAPSSDLDTPSHVRDALDTVLEPGATSSDEDELPDLNFMKEEAP